MKKLSNALKTILTGLAQQDAGEFLPLKEKMKILGYPDAPEVSPPAPTRMGTSRGATKRIALVSDGRGTGAPLDYAIDACRRQHGRLDLLVHGADAERIASLEARVRQSGIDCLTIRLGPNSAEGIAEYICNHPSLLFLVAMPDDVEIGAPVEELFPQRGGRFPVPVVLIEDRPALKPIEQPAA